jgi:hypothetical protein
MVQLALVVLLRRSRVVRLLFPAALCLLAGACIWVFHSVRVDAIGLHADSVAIQTPVKAHLRDGSTVLYRAGVLLARDTLRGPGVRYALTLRDSTSVVLVPLDSIVAMESFRRGTYGAPSVIVSALATGVAFVATVVAVVLIQCAQGQGLCENCPTVYADSAGIRALQAEGFSYTIGATSEARDVDRLGIRADRDGRIVLEVRNDALETDYINHVELLEVRDAVDETAFPDPNGAALAVRELVSATTITDDAGRDLRLLLAQPEGAAFQTDERTLAGVSLAHWTDAIYLTAPAPAGRDSVALVLRLRNSLLATLLYSEVLLGDRGARSLDWIGRDLEGEGPALARWQEQRLGLHIAIWDGQRYRETVRIRDSGPHAWKDVAAMIPVLQRDSVRVRLSFPADNWRIDQVVFAMRARRPSVHAHPLSRVLDALGREDSSALATLRRADRRYLRTSPGERFSVEVQVGAGAGVAPTFFFATQGYYEPWIGRAGLRTGRDSGVAMSLDEQLVRALQQWGTVREARERAFAAHAVSAAEMRVQ